MKTSIVFWSGTGNTEDFANQVKDAIKSADVEIYNLNDGDADITGAELVLLGCPAMGDEVLEEDVFQPWFDAADLSGKKVGLFGSYGWGDGQWLREWESACTAKGANVVKAFMFNGPDFTAEDVEAFAALA